jgi:adenosylcobinamide-GDP ribazoletransferase
MPMFDNDRDEDQVRSTEPRHPASLLADLVTATRFLTRLPISGFVVEERRLAQSMAVFPLAGIIIGMFSAAALLISLGLGFAPLAAAAVAIGCHALVTGALHEDGLADTADGFWGSDHPERRLEIMRDGHIGSYGVMALVVSVILKCALVAELVSESPAGAAASLLAAAAVSRHAIVALLASGEPARHDGLAFAAGKPTDEAKRLSMLIAVATAVVALWWAAGPLGPILSLLLAQGAVSGLGAQARRKIGGYTGDVCGAVQQASEIAVLAGVAMVA